jgi:Rrf2 family iron-sulfur cluster assembly transcriptional regulator
MRLSTKGQYAVRAIVTLSCHDSKRPVTLKAISGEEGISLSYLEQLFVKLRRGDIVKSVRGPGGGYVLAKPARDISVGEVISVVEEPLNPVACLDDDSEECVRANKCITQRVWRGLAEKMVEFLSSISIEDLRNEVQSFDTDAPGPVREKSCRLVGSTIELKEGS